MSGTDRLITLDRLRVVLDAYGAEPDRWPAEERAGAAALIDSSAEARAMFEDAAGLDRALDSMAEPTVSCGFVRRIRRLEAPPRRSRVAGLLAAIGDWLQPGSRFAWQGAVAAAAVIGIAAGIGFSELLLDHELSAPRAVAAGERAVPVVLVGRVEGVATAVESLTLEQDLGMLSLTGSRGTGSGSAYEGEDSESALAQIPLY